MNALGRHQRTACRTRFLLGFGEQRTSAPCRKRLGSRRGLLFQFFPRRLNEWYEAHSPPSARPISGSRPNLPRRVRSARSRAAGLLQMSPKARRTSAAALLQARAWYRAGMLGQSEALCVKILADEPNHVDAIYLLGAVQTRSGRWQEALANFDRVLTLKANFPEALANRGVVLGRLGALTKRQTASSRRWHLSPITQRRATTTARSSSS